MFNNIKKEVFERIIHQFDLLEDAPHEIHTVDMRIDKTDFIIVFHKNEINNEDVWTVSITNSLKE